MESFLGTEAPRSRLYFIGVASASLLAYDLLLGGILVSLTDLRLSQIIVSCVFATIAALPFVYLAARLFQDMSRTKKTFEDMANTDALTGLPNRRAFLNGVDRIAEKPGAILILLDVDRFKDVNDTYGHLEGDDCLRNIAKLIQQATPDDALLGRLGGEEFAILLPKQSASQVEALLSTLTKGVTVNRDDADGPARRVTTSAGVCTLEASDTVASALDCADAALYKAKAAGRARAHHGPSAGVTAPSHG